MNLLSKKINLLLRKIIIKVKIQHLSHKINIVFLLIFLCFESAFCSISICSWNLKDFGKSKSDVEIDFMASTIQNYDVIAIQEVVVNIGGAQAVARLVDQMNRKGKSWDYTISEPTVSSSAGKNSLNTI